MDIAKKLCAEFGLAQWQASNTIELIEQDNTIPFIARYRKELTGEIDDQKLREFAERLEYLKGLEERKRQVLKILAEQGNLTDELAAGIGAAENLTQVEDIYRPFKPKRRTRATIAAEKGLGPLADAIWEQLLDDLAAEAGKYVDGEKGVGDAAEALAGAADIIAERMSDHAGCREMARALTFAEGVVRAAASKSAKEPDGQAAKEARVFEMYFDYSEPAKKLPGHRTLAINRGESQGFLKVDLEAPVEPILAGMRRLFVKKDSAAGGFMEEAARDSYKRLIAPAVEREIRNMLTEAAQDGAIRVFKENLKQLLMQPPIKGSTVLAIDPGFRTGCKIAVVDETGKVLDTDVAYMTIGADASVSKAKLRRLISKHSVDVIAIGNGTASRETETVVSEMLGALESGPKYVIVNEAGASVYSASKLGAEEFPQFDVALRSAVSIGRRLQDPLAELVKIDPKSIGVGQYQHDMNQKLLGQALSGVVEACVNMVGADLNTASPSLLSYVAGITPAVSRNILEYREKHGKFKKREELLKVAKLGPKAYEQCAGFLRIPDGENPLDNTGVHPESYEAARKYLALASPEASKKSLKGLGARNLGFDFKAMAESLGIGEPTLRDIARELAKPGRDPRDELPPVLLRSDVLKMEDLKEGMVLKGTVRNVIDFGAFVDIGVHQDGLVHVSQISDKFIKHPLEAVQVGDVVTVKVLGVEPAKNRISLTMKNTHNPPKGVKK